jgi:hypothetical protein
VKGPLARHSPGSGLEEVTACAGISVDARGQSGRRALKIRLVGGPCWYAHGTAYSGKVQQPGRTAGRSGSSFAPHAARLLDRHAPGPTTNQPPGTPRTQPRRMTELTSRIWNEDKSLIRTGNAPQVWSAITNLVITFFRIH